MSVKFTAWPEMLAWPYLILKGWLPYRDIAVAHTPLLIVDLTLFYKVFGVGVIQLKIYTWFLILATDCLLYYLTRKLWNNKIALFALTFYIPLQILYEGNGLWFDLALAPLALVIFYLLNKKHYLGAGFIWTLAFLTKQTAFWFLIPITISTLQESTFKGETLQGMRKFAIGATCISGIIVSLIYLLHILPDIYNWTIKFGIFYLPNAAGQISYPTFRQIVVTLFPFIIVIPFLIQANRDKFNLFAWVLAGILGAFPRFEYFHLQPAIPFLAILAGSVTVNTITTKSYKYYAMLYVYILAISILAGRFVYRNFSKPTRFVEPAIVEVADFINNSVYPGSDIYIANAWDNLYALSDTLPATKPLIPYLPWYMDLPGVQDNMIEDFKEHRPKLIVEGDYAISGLGSYKPLKVSNYISENYVKVDKVGIYSLYVPK